MQQLNKEKTPTSHRTFHSLRLAYTVRCSDFAKQAEAQCYVERNRACHLDLEQDGDACECLQSGSKYGASRCRKNR